MKLKTEAVSHSLIVWLLSSPQLEMKQRSLLSLGSETEEKRGLEAVEVNPESLGECANTNYQGWTIEISFLNLGTGVLPSRLS